jgi:phosphoenolpyruvate phosphomutase
MGALATDVPKCMVEIAPGTTILSRQIEILSEAGIRSFAITTGYMADKLVEYSRHLFTDANVDFIHNYRFVETNYIVSLCNTIGRTQDDILMLHGDLVFSPTVLRSVIDSPASVVVVDRSAPVPDKDFKARLDGGGRVLEIGVGVFGLDCVPCQPLYKLFMEDWLRWQQAIETFCARGEETVYAENALNTITGEIFLTALDVGGQLCMEVDNAADLALAGQRLALGGAC